MQAWTSNGNDDDDDVVFKLFFCACATMLNCVLLYLLNLLRSAVATNACSVTRSLQVSNVEPG